MKKIFGILLISIFLLSCKTKNVVNQPVNTNSVITSNKFFFDKISEKPNFQQIKINSRLDIQSDSFIPTLDAAIYIENEQKVWINLSALFLNVARGIATNDGIKAYEKYNKTYIDSDFSYLNNLLNVNFINYGSLQKLLLGRTFVPINETDFSLTKNMEGYVLTTNKNLKIETNGKPSEYKILLKYNANFNLTEVTLQNIGTNDTLFVSYSNWVSENNLELPKSVKIIIKAKKNSEILIENTKFDFSKMETPYSVPNNYTKTEIR